MYVSLRPKRITWGATRTADTSGGFAGARIGVDPDEDNTANASVLTPPSIRVMHENGVHDALEVGSGTTYASYPRRIVSSLAPVHSPSKTKGPNVVVRGSVRSGNATLKTAQKAHVGGLRVRRTDGCSAEGLSYSWDVAANAPRWPFEIRWSNPPERAPALCARQDGNPPSRQSAPSESDFHPNYPNSTCCSPRL